MKKVNLIDTLQYNVFYFNVNARSLDTYNIFSYKIKENIKKYLKKCTSKDEFAQELKSDFMYYYWCKSEWEVIISPWVGGDRETQSKKIDVYSQIMLNFDLIVDMCWACK